MRSAPPAHPAATARAAQATVPVTIAIDPFAPGHAVPQRFLGLSFEAAALPQLALYADRGNLVTLLRSLGPGVLRFGGVTADEDVAWTGAQTPKPAWASSTIDAAQLQAIGVLARRSDWRVLLTVGLAHFDPAAAAQEVAAAHAALGPYLEAVEIGNEPDAYGRHGFRQLPWIAQGYEEEASEYREAIAALTPNVPIAGPDVSGSGAFAEWGEEEALSQQPALLTGHHYALGCNQTPPPSIEALLSAATRGRAERSLTSYLRVARTYGIPMRIDETNSVSCGGVAGISDTFASALWATGYITQVMTAGAAGMNFEGNPTNCTGYTPLCAPSPAALAEGTLRAQPDWYALLLTRSLIGARPLPTTIAAAAPAGPTSTGSPGPPEAPPGPTSTGSPGASEAPSGPTSTAPPGPNSAEPNLVAASFSEPDRSLKVVLVDNEPPGAARLALSLKVGSGMGAARVLRLTGPSQNATGGVRIAGQAVAAGGAWRAPSRTETLAGHAGVLALTLAPSSAALVTVGPAAPASGHSRRGHRHA